MANKKGVSLKLFLKSLLGEKENRKIGKFVLCKQKHQINAGIAVFTEEGYKFFLLAEKKAKKFEEKQKRRGVWKDAYEKIRQDAQKTQPSPISDEDLSNIED